MSNLDMPFPVTSISRADLESAGFDTSRVDDATMTELAARLAGDYHEQLFRLSLDILAREQFGIPRRPDPVS